MDIFPIPKKITVSNKKFEGKRYFKIAECDFDKETIKFPLSKIAQCSDGIPINIKSDNSYNQQQYTLILGDTVEIKASTKYGVNYAFITLANILKSENIFCMQVDDKPDFIYRGIMLDVSRCKVPKIETMKKYIDFLSDLKYNQLQLYFEGIIYEYKGFEKYYAGKNPVTASYLKAVKEYCSERMIELVPNHNSFGHMGNWLQLEELNHLAECPKGFDRIDEFNHTNRHDPGVLNPLDDESLKLVDRLYSDVLPNFESDMLNAGCDEAFELGKGFSKEKKEKYGIHKVFTDYMNGLDKVCKKYKKRMMFWADMIIDSPEDMKNLPSDSIPLVWGYEQEHPYYEQCKNASESGLDFFVAPGTCSWGSMTGRSENMMKNQLSAAENGKKFGAKGYLLTDWGEEGHCQFPTISYVPFAYGAGLAWGVEENKDIKNAMGYLDESLFLENGFAEFLYQCGLSYKLEAYKRFNQTAVMSILGLPLEANHYMYDQTPQNFRSIMYFVDEKIKLIDNFSACPDEYKEEIRLNLRMLKSIASVGLIKTGTKVTKEEITSLISDFRNENIEYMKLWNTKNYSYDSGCYPKYTQQLIEGIKQYC